jgi:predicted choloylglycine hydrolase
MMSSDISKKHIQFNHVTLQGTSYEAGKMQGEAIRMIPGWMDFIRSGKGALSKDEFRQVVTSFNKYCPGIREEIHGLADGAQISEEDVVYYAMTSLRTVGCSQFVVLPEASEDHHILVARSYDYSDKADDLRLTTTKIDGKYKHIGFSTMLFGRCDGFNECGLSVTSSSGGIPVGPFCPAIQDGFQFWALIRTLLDCCRNVEEALALIEGFPIGCNPILILADRSGDVALVEIYGSYRAVKRIIPGTHETFVFATNHYTLSEMQKYQTGVMNNSLVRQRAIDAFLKKESPPFNAEKIKNLLSAEYPAGLVCHHYDEFFGTMHSILFDLTREEVEICFGSPDANPWHRFDLKSQASEPVTYLAVLPEKQSTPDFWRMVQPA